MKKRLFPIALACILAIGTPAAAFAETGNAVNTEQQVEENEQELIPDKDDAENTETACENEETENIDETALTEADC